MASPAKRKNALLNQNIRDHLAMHIGQAAVDTRMAEDKLHVIDAEKVENCGVQIVAVGLVFCCLIAEIVALPVRNTCFDTSTREPGDKRSAIVVAASAAL